MRPNVVFPSILALCALACGTPSDDKDVDTDTDTDTTVAAVCGDSVVAGDEVCDDGANDGGEGGCLPGCAAVQTCGDNVTNGTEQCDDGGTDNDDGCDDTCMLEGEVASVTFDVTCILGKAVLVVPVEMTTSASAPLTTGGAITVSTRVVSTITPSIGDLVIAVGTDMVTVDDLQFDVAVTGADVSTIALGSASTPFVMDVDANDDGMADDYDLASDLVNTAITHDGSTDPVTLQMVGLTVNLTEVPVLSTLTLNVPEEDPKALVQCALPEVNPVVTLALTPAE